MGTPCLVKIDGGRDVGILIDASDEGLRIGGLDLLILFADQVVTVDYDDQEFVGRCRVVSRDENWLFQVGVFQETESYQKSHRSLLINSFFRAHNQSVVCAPLFVENEQKIRIQFLNGERANVRRTELIQLTRGERMEQLCDSRLLWSAMKFYSMDNSANEFTNRERVLNFEFGPPVVSLSATDIANPNPV